MNREQAAEHLRFAAELGVRGISRDPAWRTREDAGSKDTGSPGTIVQAVAVATPEPAPGPSAIVPAAVLLDPAAALAAIRDDLGPCTRCKLHTLGRTQVVFGVGNPGAALMFVGEAPGADEDLKGEPFVGRAGQLLTKIIESIGIDRSDVYIANVIKCRPPQNRNPEQDEMDTCEPFLIRQIEAIKPRVIVALGKFAAQRLLRTQEPISRLRGQVSDYHGAKLLPTFHPAYLLRNPSSKREVWEDMKRVREMLREPSR